MDCCETNGFARFPEVSREPPLVARRGMLKGAALLAGTTSLLASGTKKASAKSTTIQLAFCSNILCAPPYEVTRSGGHFRDEGLDVQLVYMRGSNAATQALVGGALDYAATSFDDVLQAFYAIDLAQQLRNNRVLHVGGNPRTAGAEDRIHLVEEDDQGARAGLGPRPQRVPQDRPFRRRGEGRGLDLRGE